MVIYAGWQWLLKPSKGQRQQTHQQKAGTILLSKPSGSAWLLPQSSSRRCLTCECGMQLHSSLGHQGREQRQCARCNCGAIDDAEHVVLHTLAAQRMPHRELFSAARCRRPAGGRSADQGRVQLQCTYLTAPPELPHKVAHAAHADHLQLPRAARPRSTSALTGASCCSHRLTGSCVICGFANRCRCSRLRGACQRGTNAVQRAGGDVCRDATSSLSCFAPTQAVAPGNPSGAETMPMLMSRGRKIRAVTFVEHDAFPRHALADKG